MSLDPVVARSKAESHIADLFAVLGDPQPATTAHDLVSWLVDQGWRPHLRLARPADAHWRTQRAADPDAVAEHAREARAQLRVVRDDEEPRP